MERPVVSVLMVTFNQQEYVSQAIKSVLDQQSRYSLELIVRDDCSTDETRKIVSSYVDRYPSVVRCISSNCNRGFQANFLEGLKCCSGRYVAILDGDDYWTDVNKLNKQVRMLEMNSHCTLCFGQSLEFYDDGIGISRVSPQFERIEFTIYDILTWCFIPSSTAVFRNDLQLSIPSWVQHMPMVDWVLWVLLALKGNIVHVKEVLSAYRKHSRGVWTGKTIPEQIQCDEQFYCKMREFLPHEYHEKVEQGLVRLTRTRELVTSSGPL
jgi:glycosyltransferase involved in cell wall biosynthesis